MLPKLTKSKPKIRPITTSYYRGALGAILVFDLTKSKSFENVQKWLAELKDRTEPSITMMFVGNKSNLVELREIKQESIEHYAQKNSLLYF